MVRVKGSSSTKRKKKVLKAARGYYGGRGKLYKTAKEAVRRALRYQYRDRRTRKRDFRRLWIIRINAACREEGIGYARFIHGLKLAGLDVDRQILSQIAIDDRESFGDLVALAREQLENAASAKN